MSDPAPQLPPHLQYYTDTGPPQVPRSAVRMVYILGLVISTVGLGMAAAAAVPLVQQIWGMPRTSMVWYSGSSFPQGRLALLVATGACEIVVVIGAIAGLCSAGFGRRMVMLGSIAGCALHMTAFALMMADSYTSLAGMPISWLDKLGIFSSSLYYGTLGIIYPLMALTILWKRDRQA